MHAYFAGDYVQAHKRLTAAVDAGSQDPRVFYFLGLTNLKLGRDPEAVQDFRKGAAFESRDTNKFYEVGKALERVQGYPRIELEKYRAEARMAAMEARERLRKARYEAIQREEKRVTRPMPPLPPPSLASPEPVATPAADAATEPAAVNASAAPANQAAALKPLPAAPSEKPAAEQKPTAEPDPFGE